jgi:hypothetical protein
MEGDKMSGLDEKFWCSNCGHKLGLHASGKCVGIDLDNQACDCTAAAELAELVKKVQQADWFRSTLDIALASPEKDTPFKKLEAENTQLKNEIDRYDKICTEIRNILTACNIPELTGDRLTVLPLATRVYLLGTIGAKEMERNAQLRTENAEMREALEEIKKLDFRGKAVRNFHTAGEMNNIARAVLAKHTEVKK